MAVKTSLFHRIYTNLTSVTFKLTIKPEMNFINEFPMLINVRKVVFYLKIQSVETEIWCIWYPSSAILDFAATGHQGACAKV